LQNSICGGVDFDHPEITAFKRGLSLHCDSDLSFLPVSIILPAKEQSSEYFAYGISISKRRELATLSSLIVLALQLF
jgi:hypothetical protein